VVDTLALRQISLPVLLFSLPNYHSSDVSTFHMIDGAGEIDPFVSVVTKDTVSALPRTETYSNNELKKTTP
jgi:hypothetical protein